MADTQNPTPAEEKRKPFHLEFADRIVAQLEAGTAPWLQPWHPGSANFAPHNPASGTVYRGVNRLSLAMSGYDDPRWMTFKQAKAEGLSIKEGSKSEPVVYFQWTKEETVKDEKGKPVLDKDGKEQKIVEQLDKPIMRFARVFNAEQIDGIPPMQLTDKSFEWNPVEKGESILAASGASINHDQSNRAFYRGRTDSIHMPPRENFEDAEKYYGTALHELGHWTKHPSRLNREGGPFGSEQYAREELRAEIASWMLAQDTGIPHDPGQHAAYVQSWIKAVKDDPFEIQRACRDAEQIRDYLLGLERKKEMGMEAPEAMPMPELQEEIAARSLPERPAPEKTLLSVPYREKDQAKKLGAKWDKEAKSWFAPEGTDLSKLRNWLPVEAVRVYGHTDPEREGLFSAQVQKAGLWSHIEGQDGKPILFEKAADALVLAERYLPKAPEQSQDMGRQAAPETPKPLSPEQEFAQALAKAGLDLQGQEPVLDGQIHRVPLLYSENIKVGIELGGAYCAYGGEQPYGWSQNFATGEKTPWIATGHVLSQEQIQEIFKEREEQRRDYQERLERMQNDIAATVFQTVAGTQIASKDHSFLKEREVEAFGVHQDANTLYIPMRNAVGEIRNLQIIEEKGVSRFLIGGERDGLLHLITGQDQNKAGLYSVLSPLVESLPGIERKDLAQGEIILAENYASGASLHMATGKPVAVAFTSENLKPVAEVLREQFPQAAITICATNNQYERADGTVHNRGVIEAERAAQAVGGKVIVPEFTDNEKSRSLENFNELHVSRGLGEVKRQFEGPALDKMQEKEVKTEKNRKKAQDKSQERGLSL